MSARVLPASHPTVRVAVATGLWGCMTAVLVGCAGTQAIGSPAGPTAGDVRVGPDCLADEVLSGFGVEFKVRKGIDLLPGPLTPGTRGVPDGFHPAYVVECRLDAVVSLRPGETATIDPETGAVSKTPDGSGNGISADDDRLVVRVAAVRLEGDLAPLIAELSRSDEAVSARQTCELLFIAKPQIYLVDAQGHAVRVQWPTDICEFVFPSGRAALTALNEVDSTMMVRSLG